MSLAISSPTGPYGGVAARRTARRSIGPMSASLCGISEALHIGRSMPRLSTSCSWKSAAEESARAHSCSLSRRSL
eukprot:4506373-Prymnesium_polylepis.1